MRCDEVIRELAVPTDDRDGTVLAEHLASCPSCDAWARRAALLDQLWDATRPSQPSPEAWDSVWANITQAIQSPSAERKLSATSPTSMRLGASPKVFTHSDRGPVRSANHPRTRRFVAMALMGLAQAAAILIAVGLAWHPQPGPPIGQNAPVAQNDTPLLPRVLSVIRVSGAVMVEADIDIEEGHMMVICVDGPAAKLVDVTPPEIVYGIGNRTTGDVVMFNVAESFATTVVASQ